MHCRCMCSATTAEDCLRILISSNKGMLRCRKSGSFRSFECVDVMRETLQLESSMLSVLHSPVEISQL